MDERARSKRLPHVVEMLLWAGWFSAPIWLWNGAMVAAPFFGETATADEVRQSHQMLAVGLGCGLGFPFVGMALAGWAGRRDAVWRFAVAFALTAGLLGWFVLASS